MAGEARLPQTSTVQGVTRRAAGAVLGYAVASPAPLMGIAYYGGRALGLAADALLGGTDDLP